jgi:predicted Zn-dependent peptidase
VGHFDRKVALIHLDRALASLGPVGRSGSDSEATSPGPTRLSVQVGKSDRRALYGWTAPALGAKDDAAVQVAVQILAGRKESRFQRELVKRQLAASVRGFVDPGWEISAAAIELTPAATVDIERLQRRAEAIIDDLAAEGPNRVEIAYAKAILAYRIRKKIAQSTEAPSPDLAQATLGGQIVHALQPGFWQDALERLEKVDDRDVRRAVRRHLGAERRVVVVSLPDES